MPHRPRSPHVYIVHGYDASPEAHWFPWLKQQLDAEGYAATVLAMPASGAPDVDRWRRTLERDAAHVDRQTFFVAHSLGCLSVLHYLDGLPDGARVGGLVLVSGFVDPLPDLPDLDPFTAPAIAFERIIRRTEHRTVIASRNDPIVPYAHTVRLQQALDATLLTVEQGGHFLASDGFRRHPLVDRALRQMLPQATPDAA